MTDPVTTDDAETLVRLACEDPLAFLPDRQDKERALCALADGLAGVLDVPVRRDAWDWEVPWNYAPHYHEMDACLDRRVGTRLRRIDAHTLRRGPLVYLDIGLCDFAPWWAAWWHEVRLHGRQIVRTVHDLNDVQIEPRLRALAQRLTEVAETQGWSWLPREVRERQLTFVGGSESIGHLAVGMKRHGTVP